MNPDILAILESIQVFMDYLAQEGGNLSPEAQAQLVDFIQESISFVEEYQGRQLQAEGEERIPSPVDQLDEPTLTPSIPTGGPVPQLEAAPNPSSNINAFRYNNGTGELFVKFQDKFPGQNGPIYSYQNVPPYIFDIFSRGAVAPKTSGANAWHRWQRGIAPSHGASMWALLRAGGFPYQRIR